MKYIKREQLQYGNYYVHSTTYEDSVEEWIFLWQGDLNRVVNLKLKGRKAPKFGINTFAFNKPLREANNIEISHIIACIEANKYVEYHLSSEIY